MVCHLVPSSPRNLGFHIQGFWPVGLWGPPQGCFNITWLIPHTCDTPSDSQKTWLSPGVAWLGAWVPPGQRLVLIPCCSLLATQKAKAPALRIVLGWHGCLGKVYLKNTTASRALPCHCVICPRPSHRGRSHYCGHAGPSGASRGSSEPGRTGRRRAETEGRHGPPQVGRRQGF